jgi:hypothetical protein
MAKAQGVSPATVQRIWSSRGLKPHLVKTFKLSGDPKFEEKLIDVVGLYLNPPDNAVVLCMDEKSSVQALDRTQPPADGQGPGRHDDPRLQAARDHHAVRGAERAHRRRGRPVPTPTSARGVPEVPQDHRQADPERTAGPPDPGQLRHPQARQRPAWLAKHPRFHLHFTPTSSSWLNLVERGSAT